MNRTLSILALLLPTIASSAVLYHVTDLGALPGGNQSDAAAINSTGQIVGNSFASNGQLHACLWSHGTIQDLGVFPGGTMSQATSINASAQIVGEANDSMGNVYAFQYANGTMNNLGTLPGGGLDLARAASINGFGQVAGDSTSSQGAPLACVWSNGSPYALAGSQSFAMNIDDSGNVVGQSVFIYNGVSYHHAFLYANGLGQDLGTFPGGGPSQANAINSAGTIVGFARLSDGNDEACMWVNGTIQALPNGLEAVGINASGQVISNSGTEPYVYSLGQSRKLNAFLDSSSAGFHVDHVSAINDSGAIVGSGITPLGAYHAFLVTPVANGPRKPPPPLAILGG